jgi:hypothetical protein
MGIGRGLWNASLLYWLQMNRAARYYTTTHTEASAFTEAYCGPFCVWCPLGIRHRGHQAGLRRPCFFRQPTTDPVQVMFLSCQYVSQHHTDSSLNNNPKHLPLSIAMYRETRGMCKHSPLHRRRTCRVSRLVSYSLRSNSFAALVEDRRRLVRAAGATIIYIVCVRFHRAICRNKVSAVARNMVRWPPLCFDARLSNSVDEMVMARSIGGSGWRSTSGKGKTRR